MSWRVTSSRRHDWSEQMISSVRICQIGVRKFRVSSSFAVVSSSSAHTSGARVCVSRWTTHGWRSFHSAPKNGVRCSCKWKAAVLILSSRPARLGILDRRALWPKQAFLWNNLCGQCVAQTIISELEKVTFCSPASFCCTNLLQ